MTGGSSTYNSSLPAGRAATARTPSIAGRAGSFLGTMLGWNRSGGLDGRAPTESQWHVIARHFAERRSARWGAIGLIVIAAACCFMPLLLSWSPTQIDPAALDAAGPSARHLLGTDTLGRDELTRLLCAGRISLLIGFSVALICAVFGSLIGALAGYLGGRADALVTTLITMLLTIPALPLLIALSALVANPESHLGGLVRATPEWMRIVLVLTTLGWMTTARAVRAKARAIRSAAFVEAARANGATTMRILIHHVVPSALPSIVAIATFGVSGAILGESSLSFLGVGVNPPTATWGNMIAGSADIVTVMQHWWLVWCPALAIFATVLCANFVGEGLRDAISARDR